MTDEQNKWKVRFERERAARRQAEELLHEKSRELYLLNQQLKERADELSTSLHRLEDTQEQLVESAKLASLGRLVAGISHEINTPLGVSMMAVSHGRESLEKMTATIEGGRVSKAGLLSLLEDGFGSLESATRNLRRSADLVQSFKRVVR